VDSFAFRAIGHSSKGDGGNVKLQLQHVRPWLPRTEDVDAEFTVNVSGVGGGASD
jgi:hypothetical protein